MKRELFFVILGIILICQWSQSTDETLTDWKNKDHPMNNGLRSKMPQKPAGKDTRNWEKDNDDLFKYGTDDEFEDDVNESDMNNDNGESDSTKEHSRTKRASCGDRLPWRMRCKNWLSCNYVGRNWWNCQKKLKQIRPRWCIRRLTRKQKRTQVKNYCRQKCWQCVPPPPPPPVDGFWGGWSGWFHCWSGSSGCEPGEVKRIRLCNNPTPQHGGSHCSGHSAEYWSKVVTDPNCGIHPSRLKRGFMNLPIDYNDDMEILKIVGGSEVTPYSLPWQVGIVKPGWSRPFCGGILIGPRHVLTAAHCVDQGLGFEVVVGEHEILSTSDGTRHKVCGMTSHPDHHKYATNGYDFAVIRLTTPVITGPRAVPVCLVNATMTGDTLAGENVTVSGWGALQYGMSGPNSLHSADVQVITNAQCQALYNQAGKSITNSMLCAGNPAGGIDSCQGDSGGPLTWTKEGRAHLVGVVSWGVGCGNAQYPGVYGRVTTVLDWIITEMALRC